MGLTTALLVTAAVGAAAGGYGVYQSNQQAKSSKSATEASLVKQGVEDAKAKAEAQKALTSNQNNQAAEAQNADIATALEASKKRRGVQSTFTTVAGAGQGAMKGTTLSPLGGD